MLESLQYLRAIGSLLVVGVHLEPPLQRLGLEAPWLYAGAFGVDIFFVLSGFLILVTTYRKTDYTAEFYRKRWLRIVPLYWMITTVVLILLLATPQLVKSGSLDTWHVISSYLFLPSPHPVLGSLEPLFVPGWTMNYEVFYFVTWGLILFLPQKARAPAFGALIVGLVTFGTLVKSSNPLLVFYTSPLMLEFVFGLLLGIWYKEGAPLPRPLGWALIGLGLLALLSAAHTTPWVRVFQRGLPAMMLLAGAITLERARPVRRIGVFALLGDASYSTYLTHSIILSAVGQVFARLPLTSPAVAGITYGVTGVAAAIAGSIVFHKVVERRLLKLMRDKPAGATSPARTKVAQEVSE